MFKIKLSTLCSSTSAWVFTIVFASLLSSCGYHLSGTSEHDSKQLFSPVLKKVAIEGLHRSDDFRVQLKKDLIAYRMRVVAPPHATARIIIKNRKIDQQVITIGDDAKAREYLLTSHINFSVLSGNGDTSKVLLSERQIQAETTYLYYPQHISISANEKKRAMTYLNQDLSRVLISRLGLISD